MRAGWPGFASGRAEEKSSLLAPWQSRATESAAQVFFGYVGAAVKVLNVIGGVRA